MVKISMQKDCIESVAIRKKGSKVQLCHWTTTVEIILETYLVAKLLEEFKYVDDKDYMKKLVTNKYKIDVGKDPIVILIDQAKDMITHVIVFFKSKIPI